MLMLFHNAPSPYHTSVPFVVALTLAIGGLWAIGIAKAVQVRRSPVHTGVKTMVGEQGVARPGGHVFVHGELWRAREVDGDVLRPGDPVEVTGVEEEGLVLAVRPVDHVT
jgi:membrane-bound ClpP family serine protease